VNYCRKSRECEWRNVQGAEKGKKGDEGTEEKT
jgi:hypothetical protein